MTTAGNQRLPDELLPLVASRFKLMGDPTRLKIIEVLRDKELSVGDVALAAHTSQANTSKHLTALFEANLVTRRRQGGLVLYRAAGRVPYLLIDAICSGLDTQITHRRELLAAARPSTT